MALPTATEDTCCTGEPWCTVVCTAQVLHRKWQLFLVSCLLDVDAARFSQLEGHASGISGKVLSETLQHLQDQGLVTRVGGSDEPGYALTRKGRDLRPVVDAMRTWGERYLVGAQAAPLDP